MRHKNWITAPALEKWADSTAARSLLPQLLRRLVQATLAPGDIEQIQFPSGEGVQRPGIDGITITRQGNSKVPVGKSDWEAGCDKGINAKANGDYAKRSPDPESTFIFVTPRKWLKKNTWSTSKQQEGWRGVRAYDSADLEEWIERSPAVDVWLAHEIGLKPAGVFDLGTHWKNVVSSLRVPLPPSIVLTDRNEEVTKLLKWLTEPASALAIEAASANEVLDFIAAMAANLDDNEQATITSKALIVEDREAWRSLAASQSNLLLIASPRLELDPELVSEAVRQGNHVAFLASKQHQARGKVLKLRRMFHSSLHCALGTTELGEAEVQRIANEAGGSFTVLKRLLSNDLQHSAPSWSQGQQATALAPLMLFGAWDGSNPADKESLEKVAGRPYSELLALANRLQAEPDAPVMRVGKVWSFVSRADAWRLLHWSLTSDVLDRFEAEVDDVLSEANPAFELPVDERYMASIKGKTMKHSHALREGSAETLALMGMEGAAVEIGDACALHVRSLKIVRRLFEGADWLRWASLAPHLPDLAEASPDEFLQAVEADLRREAPALPQLFEQEGDGLFGSSPHTDLLWALEALAWEPRFLGRSSIALARLASLDPGGRLSNRPAHTLRDIFLPWHPQTTAQPNERLTVLSRMLRLCPDSGWSLLLDLLPKSHDSTSGTYKPKWQNWLGLWKDGVTPKEHYEAILSIANLVVNNAAAKPGRWMSLAKHVTELPDSVFDKVLEALANLTDETCAQEEMNSIWNILRQTAQRHRWAQGLEWALPLEVVLKLEAAVKKLAPKDLLESRAWLLESREMFHIGHHDQPHEETEALHLSARIDALRQIWDSLGLKGVLNMARRAHDPWLVGSIAQRAELLIEENNVLADLLVSGEEGEQGFSKGLLKARYAELGWEWLKSLSLEKWSSEQAAIMLSIVPFQPKVWNLASDLGPQVEEAYWRRAWCYANGLTYEQLVYVVAKLREHGRHLSVLDIVHNALHAGLKLDGDLILSTLESVIFVGTAIQEKPGDAQMIQYHICELYKNVRDRAEISNDRLVSLEWACMILFDSKRIHPRALHRQLADQPSLFAEALSYSYRARSERGKPQRELDEGAKLQAKKARKLIASWHTLPGSQEDGKVNYEKLSSWVNEARQKCKEKDLVAIGDLKIGELLFHSPNEADGTWPCLAVRNVLEDTNSPEILRGFDLGIVNSRGVYSKSLTEGGAQERALALKYQLLADQLRGEWPMVAATLQRVADSYTAQATQEDENLHAL